VLDRKGRLRRLPWQWRWSQDKTYNQGMERKIFWLVFAALGLLADFLLPFWWAVAATFPILYISWWVAYRSDWF
jgi:hypothetical protein